MSKTAISGVLWGSNPNKQRLVLTSTGILNTQFVGRATRNPEPPSVLIYDAVSNLPPIIATPTNESTEHRRAIDLLDRARIRSARGRHNSEGFGE